MRRSLISWENDENSRKKVHVYFLFLFSLHTFRFILSYPNEHITHSPISRNELKITTILQLKYATDQDFKSIGFSRPEMRRLHKFYDKYCAQGYLSKIKRFLQPPTMMKRDEVSLFVKLEIHSFPISSLYLYRTSNSLPPVCEQDYKFS